VIRGKVIVHSISDHQNEFSWCLRVPSNEKGFMVVIKSLDVA